MRHPLHRCLSIDIEMQLSICQVGKWTAAATSTSAERHQQSKRRHAWKNALVETRQCWLRRRRRELQTRPGQAGRDQTRPEQAKKSVHKLCITLTAAAAAAAAAAVLCLGAWSILTNWTTPSFSLRCTRLHQAGADSISAMSLSCCCCCCSG